VNAKTPSEETTRIPLLLAPDLGGLGALAFIFNAFCQEVLVILCAFEPSWLPHTTQS
jgi:hypothetical protein